MTTKDDKNIEVSTLLDSSYPLLKRLREEAPGTYKHSQIIMGIVETIANELNLNVELMKIRALYHDVGKILSPLTFSENQTDDYNIHDNIEPDISYQLLSRHVSDSVMVLMNDGNFPIKVIKSISRHHGTTLMRHFFNNSNSEEKNDFRYKTEKPKNVEDLILMVADSVEAAARSKAQHGKLDNVGSIVDSVMANLMNDGQFDEVYMRLGDYSKIKTILKKEIASLYQKRVDYKEEKIDELNKKEEGDE